MAENTIRIETDDIPAATGFEQRLKSLTSVLQLLGPQFRQFGTALRNAVDNSRKFGASIGALGALAGAAIALRKGLQWLNEAAEQAAQKLQDFAGKGNDMLDERRQRTATLNDLPRLMRERETLVKQLETQRQNVMAAGNNLPSTYWGAAWDKAKGWGFMNDWFGTESAAQDYDFESQQYDQTKKQLDAVDQMIRKLQTEERQTNKGIASAEKATIKEIVQAAKDAFMEGQHEIAAQIAEKQYELDEKKRIEDEDKASMTLLKNAPMWLQDQIRNADKTTPAKREDWSKFINAMDKIGGYMSGFTQNIERDRQLDELKKQTIRLNEIAANTKNGYTPRYN